MVIIKKLIAIILLTSFFTSCMVTKTNIGSYKELDGDSYVYSKKRQLYLLGIMRLGKGSPATPASKNCQVKTKIGLMDCIISGITFTLLRSQTIIIMAKKEDMPQGSTPAK